MLTLHVASGVAQPDRAPWRQVGDWSDREGVVFARAFVSGPRSWIDWPGLAVFAFQADADVVSVWPAEGCSNERLEDIFERVVQPVILQAKGSRVLHASAVSGQDGALVFCGKGGLGKSTLAFALARSGFTHLADDATILQNDGPLTRAIPLPFAPSLREASRRYFATPGNHPTTTASESKPLRAIFVLERQADAGPPIVERLDPVRAFSTVLTHAHCFNSVDRVETARLAAEYLDLVAEVPTFALRFFPTFDRLAATVQAVVETAETVYVKPVLAAQTFTTQST